MKYLFLLSIAVIVSNISFAQHSLKKVWQTDTTLKAPESALYDPKAKIIYVSNIGDFDKEGVAFISKVGLDGKVVERNWVTGLTATKGLGKYGNLLYVAETNTVAVIDISTGKIIKRIPVDGAQMLNDITIDSKGIVYVSDTKTNKVHRIEDGKVSVYLENMPSANGLLAVGQDLYILTDSVLQKADANKNLTTLVRGIEGGADGIEMIAPNQFIITGWGGVIYFAKADGTIQVLSDTRAQKINTADLGYNPSAKIIYVPAMLNNMMVAYKVE